MDLFVRVIAPTGRDSELITSVLQQNGVPARAVTLSDFLADAGCDATFGPLLIAEEALTRHTVDELGQFLAGQPSWSDLPILILTGSGRETLRDSRLRAEHLPLGSPILLERPIRTATLISSVNAARRARRRQYEIRDTVAALTDERELLEAMLDNLPVGLVFARANGEVVRANRRLDEILRHPPVPNSDLDRHAQWIAFQPDGRRVAACEFPLPRAIDSGHAIPPEDFLCQRGDATLGWVRIAAAPVLNALGQVTGGVVALSDIDQQKRAEAALIQSEKLAAVGRLAASISHEINNPLEAVVNLLYLAQHSGQLLPEVAALLETADQELARVSQIVSHTLRFYRQSTRPRAVSARDLLEAPLGLYQARIANAGIDLSTRYRDTTPVECYEGEIRQVLNNLIGNAVDAMKRGGHLIARTYNARSPQTGQPGVLILIADSGPGIEPAALQHIFDAFFTTKGINGTGLGLWIAKGIVDKHLGSLRVRSCCTPGRTGTAFTLFLPANP